MKRRPLIVLTLAAFSAAATCFAQSEVSGVRDRAALFSPEAVRKADEVLRAVHRDTGWQVVVESIASLDGQTVRESALAKAKALNVHGVYLLIAKKEHLFHIAPSHSAEKALPKEKIDSLVKTINADFHAKDFDKGLMDAVTQIQKDLALSPRAANLKSAPAPIKSAARTEAPGVPPARTEPKVVPKPASLLPIIIVGGLGAIVLLWLLSKAFGPRNPVPQQGGWQPPQAGPQPGYAPPAGPRAAPPYSPPPGPGPAPSYGPAPGYGPPVGYGPPPGPGYPAGGGYGAPPPQRGGGGFIPGVLGGIGGAIAGNILYDKFGRPHHDQEGHAHESTAEGAVPHAHDGGGVEPPRETFDPNAGATGDWGGDQGQPNPPSDQWAGGAAAAGSGDWGGAPAESEASPAASGDWGANDPAAGATGDWGEAAAEPAAETGGGDWSEPAPEPTESPDWGGDNSGGSDDNQGGTW